MKRIKLYYLKAKKESLICGGIALALVFAQVVIPLVGREILNRVSETLSLKTLIIGLGVYALSLVVFNILNVIWYQGLDKLGGKILHFMRNDLMEALYSTSVGKVIEYGKEKIKNILYADTISVFGGFSVQLINLITQSLITILFVIMSFFVNYRMGIILIVIGTLGLLFAFFTRKVISSRSLNINLKMKETNKISNEYVDALETLKVNGFLYHFLELESQANAEFVATSVKADRITVALKMVLQHFHMWASLLISGVIIILYNCSVGDLIFTMLLLDIVLDSTGQIEQCVYGMMKVKPSIEHINDILDMYEEDGDIEIEKIKRIEFKNVSVDFGDKKLLTKWSECFTIPEKVRIIGANGSGKSTIIKLALGLLEPNEGEILINDTPIRNIRRDSLIKNIAVASQDEFFLDGTYMEYLKKAVPMTTEQDINNVLKYVGLSEDGIISSLGGTLSGGERKKLLFAKIMLAEKYVSLIVLDEIEAEMDIDTKELFSQWRQRCFENKRLMLVEISHVWQNDDLNERTVFLK